MCPSSKVTETAAQVRMDQIVKDYYDLGKAIKATEEARDTLRGAILEWMGDEQELEVEGLPRLRWSTRSTGKRWDSHAVQHVMVKFPAEWERLVELGCVEINGKRVKDCIEAGQLLGYPPGFTEGQSKAFLAFDR